MQRCIRLIDLLLLIIFLQILMFQKGFTDEERSKLAVVTGIILANGLCTPKILQSLFEEHLVKEGL